MTDTWLYRQLMNRGIQPDTAAAIQLCASIIIVLLVIAIATVVMRRLLHSLCRRWITRSSHRWDEIIIDHRVIDTISWYIPILLLNVSIDTLLPTAGTIRIIMQRVVMAFFVLVTVLSVNAILSAAGAIARTYQMKRADVLNGFIDAAKIISYVIGAIFLVSILSGMSPWGILSVLGGMTAVVLLIFKDTIIGFVASVQLTATDMVRIGDWIEMPAYGADGDVISISIHTIRVQNWDKTITTIPTYALVANSFKNWRGMTESGGRRIKRAIMIDINSIRFCDQEMIERFGKIRLLAEYITAKTGEIDRFNRQQHISDDTGSPLDGRQQTNIGVFRAYVAAYLQNHPQINRDMTFLVRHLPPTEHGLPLEIYVFSKDKRWAVYESIQADIFDHLFAALPQFSLRVFQNPSGSDLQAWGNSAGRETIGGKP